MTAVDTNVVIRLLTGDDARQQAGAKALFSSGRVWISKTVLLEVEWVLRSSYGYDAGLVRNAIRGLLGLPQVIAEDSATVARALDLGDAGVDFADALHLTGRPPGVAFATFDEQLIKRAKRAGEKAVQGFR